MLAALAAFPAAAADDATPAADESSQEQLSQRLDALEQELAVVRRQLEVKQEEEARDKERSGLLTVDSQGFQLRSRDQKTYRLRLRGYVHSDGRLFLENDEGSANDTFLIRRARPILEGTLFEVVDFRIMPDFGGSGTSSSANATLQDAWVNFRPWSALQLQSGKFKAPAGLERLQSATALTFIERALPTQLVPNRDVGLQLWGDLREGFAQYQFAVMNGVIDGGSADADTNDSFDVLGRVFVHPFQETSIEPLQGFGLGMAASYGRQDTGTNTATSTSTPQYRTAGQQIFFSYGVGVSQVDDQLRLAPQATWYWGPFGAMAEWVRSKPNLRLAGNEMSPDVDAWQLTTSWVVTGENRSYQGVVPRSSFNPAREDGGAGAFELAARISGFHVDDEVFDQGFANPASAAQEALEWGVGINWYVNPFLKLALDYNDTKFDGGAPEGRDRSTEGVLMSRFQVAF